MRLIGPWKTSGARSPVPEAKTRGPSGMQNLYLTFLSFVFPFPSNKSCPAERGLLASSILIGQSAEAATQAPHTRGIATIYRAVSTGGYYRR